MLTMPYLTLHVFENKQATSHQNNKNKRKLTNPKPKHSRDIEVTAVAVLHIAVAQEDTGFIRKLAQGTWHLHTLGCRAEWF